MTVENLTGAIIREVECRVTDSADDDLAQFIPVHLSDACMVLKSEKELLFLVADLEGSIGVSEDADFLFRVLSNAGKLDQIVASEVVDELNRLRLEVVQRRLAEKESRDREEYARLKAKFEGI